MWFWSFLSLWVFLSFFFFFPKKKRRYRRGDLCHCVGAGDRGPIPLQQNRDVSEPGSESGEARGQPRVPLQQPGGLSERPPRKPEGVFHLAGALTLNRPRWDLVGWLYRALSALQDTTGLLGQLEPVQQQDVESETEQSPILFILPRFVHIVQSSQTGKSV